MVAIEGIMGTGKSTLQKRLQQELDARIIVQDFVHNISLSDSYVDQSYIFEKQMIFLFSDYHLLHKNTKIPKSTQPVISDFTLERSEIMARLLLTSQEYQDVFLPAYLYLSSKLNMNKMLILLHGGIDNILLKIKKRNRQIEKNISADFLEVRQTHLLNNLNHINYDKLLMINIDTIDTMDDKVIMWLKDHIIRYEKGE